MQIRSAILWSVIAAAFVGPGTVATAAYAGSTGGLVYLLPLFVALLAGFLLMEMAARVTLVTAQPLGYAVRATIGSWATYVLFGGIFLGCAAYEAGNLGGGFAGLELFSPLQKWWVLFPALIAGVILFLGSSKKIGRVLALVVVLMGAAFLLAGLSVVFSAGPAPVRASGGVQTATVLSLFGTTIVPYNFMLAAGLGRSQTLQAMRNGLGLSFLVGGLISLGILLTGTAIDGFDDFGALATALDEQIGGFGRVLLGVGLFAAGFSSAITAPLAAAMAGKTLFEREEAVRGEWSVSSLRFRVIWLLVLGIGLAVALLQLKIVPVLLAAQLVNALLLPFLAALMIFLGNRQDLLGEHTNTWWQNVGGLLVFGYLTFKSGQVILGFWG